MITRRNWVKAAAAGLLVSPKHSSAAFSRSAGLRLQGLETIQVEGKLRGVMRLPDQRLMAWWTEGKQGEKNVAKGIAGDIYNREIPQKAFARYSLDHGYHWSEPQLLLDFPREEGMFTSGIGLSDRSGTIHLFGLHYFGTGEKGFYDWANAKGHRKIKFTF